MTPRTVRGGPSLNFAQQLAQHNSDQSQRKFKSRSAPRGVKLGAGYSDRASARLQGGDTQDERASRIQALEEQMKLGQIERDTFEALRDQITAGDIGATHLVKGLDRKLLERIKRGEDVLAEEAKAKDATKDGTPEPEVNAEDELAELENADITPVQREEIKKRGEMAPPPKPTPVAGVKRSRADILAELKASRKAEAEAKAAAQLGSKFRKLNSRLPEPRIERDEKGREVLITVDENGRVKRKVRKVTQEEEKAKYMPAPAASVKPLGMVVPTAPQAAATAGDDDDDIFEGVGDAYDPLGAVEDDLSSSESEGEAMSQPEVAATSNKSASKAEDEGELPSEDALSDQDKIEPAPSLAPKRNYFNERSPSPETLARNRNLNDPAILETLRRASAHAKASETATDESNKDSNATSSAAQRLFKRDRDLDDMDMGFGDSRFGDDEEDEDGGKIKLSNWKGLAGDDEDDDDGGDGKGKGGKERKRGKKKRKGDKNSAADVLGVIEGRKK